MITLIYKGERYELARTPEMLRLASAIAGREITLTEADSLVLEMKPPNQPLLGLATTKQLLEEIAARGRTEDYYLELGLEMEVGAKNLQDRLPGSMLAYRTAQTEAEEKVQRLLRSQGT